MQKIEGKQCACPFCVKELTKGCTEPPFCSPCNVTIVKCAECDTAYASDKHKQCPKCGSSKI